MAKLALLLAFLAASGAATGALADGTAPAAPTSACDFFQAELIGEFCAHTAYVAPFGRGSDETVDYTHTVPRFGRFGGGTTVEHWDYQNAFEGVTAAVSPWQGVQFHVSGEAFQFDDSYSYWKDSTFGGFGRGPMATQDSGGIPGWETVGAAVTLWDTHFGTPFGPVHSVFNVVGGLQMLPGGGPYQSRDEQQIGWQSGAELPLGGSGYAIDYLGTDLFQRFDNPGLYVYDNTTRVLLANDAYGVAAGPLLEGASVLWHAPGHNTGWSAFSLGGEALLEPFRRTNIPVLRDVTIDLTGAHSLGQADLVPNWAGSSSGYVYSASARFNFAF